jgi:hypothetical protein
MPHRLVVCLLVGENPLSGSETVIESREAAEECR